MRRCGSGKTVGELMMRAAVAILALCAASASAFYLPGVAPKEYTLGEQVCDVVCGQWQRFFGV